MFFLVRLDLYSNVLIVFIVILEVLLFCFNFGKKCVLSLVLINDVDFLKVFVCLKLLIFFFGM